MNPEERSVISIIRLEHADETLKCSAAFRWGAVEERFESNLLFNVLRGKRFIQCTWIQYIQTFDFARMV
jgi:hypothetical protein